VRFALVGCGDISRRYAAAIAAVPGFEVAAVTDAVGDRARALADELGVRRHDTLDDLLAAEDVDIVVNLTAPLAHAAVSARCLDAGRHVHTEKPLAMTYAEARSLVELADARGVRLSCAPATLLGEAQQAAWKLLRDGAIGRVRLAYAEANWGLIERWHAGAAGLHAVGPLVDVGIYPLTLLTAIFGPVRRVSAYTTTLVAERRALDGSRFRPGAPDLAVALLELDGGVVVRLTASFYAGTGVHRGVELHGDLGRLFLASWAEFDSRVELSVDGAEYEPQPPLREPYRGIDWARPLVDLRDALAAGRPHRAAADHAAHVVEVLEAVPRAAESGPLDLESSFTPPEPLEWAR